MWNRENAIRLTKKIAKEYGKEILAEGSKSVIGFEDHVDKMVAGIIGVDSEIVTAAREWRKVIGRAAMHEGIEKVENVLKQESSEIINNFNVRKIEESKMNLEAINIAEAPSTERIEVEMITDEAQTKATEIAKNKAKCMEGIKIIQENIVDLAKSLEDSIWAPREERCEIIKDIKAKISAANVLRENSEH